MQKTYHKKLLGIAGLLAVGLMTAVAAALPNPASATSISDTITIKVVDGTPSAYFNDLSEGEALSSSKFNLRYTYNNLTHIKISMSYTGGRSRSIPTVVLLDEDLDVSGFEIPAASGEGSIPLDLAELDGNNYAIYKNYTFSIEGTGMNGETVNDAIATTYTPFELNGEVELDATTDDPVIMINALSSDVAYYRVVVYDGEGQEVTITDPVTSQTKPFVQEFTSAASGLRMLFATNGVVASGAYTFNIKAYNSHNRQVGEAVNVNYEYEAPNVPSTPQTGSFISSLNLAREDYAITGLIVFGIALVLIALLFRKKNSRR